MKLAEQMKLQYCYCCLQLVILIATVYSDATLVVTITVFLPWPMSLNGPHKGCSSLLHLS